MKQDISIGGIIKTSIVTAFTIAAALIWKDVITETINKIIPPGDRLVFKFIAAILVTILVVIAIFVILKTESSAENIFRRFRKRGKK
jgi:hypothetical protein